jgi:hypothetical protein
VNLVTGRHVPAASARLEDEYLAADLSIILTGPDAAPRIRGDALVENDARQPAADIGDCQALSRGDSDAVKRLRTDLPGDPVRLACGGDLGDADIARPFLIHARDVIGTRNRIIGAGARHAGHDRRHQGDDQRHEVSQGAGTCHFGVPLWIMVVALA